MREYFIYFNGLRKRRKMSGSSEAKHGPSLQTSSVANKEGGPDEDRPIPGRGQPVQQCNACLLWVTVIGIHLRTSIAVSASLASWQVADLVLFNDPHRGQGRRTWGDTQDIPGFVSSPLRQSWLSQWVCMKCGVKIVAVEDWFLPC